eukprot:CAMPEP_0118935454 /NCGR_PEP_ID=MMETSP1169-20130426/15652_1 /TAXON_ID=36882 /ORGANISM="Pyramimonas obovata, Strain CCMP722" /LENGTH=263 /DNA_ID=CAMNT_0006878497 /DNA_START=181 /DNA_END=968 /DNA_ORIENTATION=+
MRAGVGHRSSRLRGRMLVASTLLLLGFACADDDSRGEWDASNSLIEKNKRRAQPESGTFCPKKEDSVVVFYENTFDDEFQHDNEERLHPDSVYLNEGSLSLNGSASTTAPLWRVNVQPEDIRKDNVDAFCVSTRKLSKWGDVGFELVLADSDGEILSVGYARRSIRGPLAVISNATKNACWARHAGRTFLARKDGGCSTSSLECCAPLRSVPTPDRWVQDVLCYAPATGDAWLSRVSGGGGESRMLRGDTNRKRRVGGGKGPA